MELQAPFRVITPTLDGDVLGVLASADADFTPPQVHRLLGRHSVDGVRRVLVRLAEQGIALSRPAGRAQLYRLNRDHLAAPAILQLARAKELLLERLSGLVKGWRVPCEYGAVFGSATRTDMGPGSDLDLFLVRPEDVGPDDPFWFQQTIALSKATTAWTGNDTRILEYGADELRAAVGAADPVLSSVRLDGLPFAGPDGYLDRLFTAHFRLASRQ
jgi:hypothetical protein